MDDQNPHFEITPSDEPASKRARVASLPLTLIKSKSKVLTRSKFAETIDPKLCQRMIDAGVLYRTKDGGWMDREYGCTEEQQVDLVRQQLATLARRVRGLQRGGSEKGGCKSRDAGFL